MTRPRNSIDEAVDSIRDAWEDAWRFWPLVLVRLAQQIVLFIAFLISAIVTIVPLVVGGVVAFSDFSGDAAGFLRSLFFEHPFLILYLFLAVLAIATVLMLFYAFFQAGLIGSYEEAIRTGTSANPAERFLHFARQSWRRTFWIFQWIWGLVGVVFMVPLLPIVLVMLLGRDSTGILIAGCVGLGLLLVVMLIASFFASGWSAVSLILGITRQLPARQAVTDGWRLFRKRLAPVMLVMVFMSVVSMVVTAALVSFSFGVSAAGSVRYAAVLLFPLQIAISIVQMGSSIFVSCWFTAALIRVSLPREVS